jgi:hypothetical protein
MPRFPNGAGFSRRRVSTRLVLLLSCLASAQTPEEKAIQHLSREVASWRRENGCFSCHNNGDGARALYTARARGYTVADAAVQETSEWLLKPGGWTQSPGDPRFSDKRLSRLQFTVALAAANLDAAALRQAARLLAADQRADGSWLVEGDPTMSSPVTWGPVLATALAARSVRRAGLAEAAARGEAWLLKVSPANTIDAAAILMAAGARRRDCLDRLRQSQTSEGGWGPRPNAPAEVFDTAAALLALNQFRDDAAVGESLARARNWLVEAQLENGGWPETTRPSGGQSYAQHISTSAWALLALLEVR